MPWGPVAEGMATPRGVEEPSQLDALVCGVCGLKLEFWGRSKSDQTGAANEIWVFGCHDRHQGWEYDPATGRWWLKEHSNPVST